MRLHSVLAVGNLRILKIMERRYGMQKTLFYEEEILKPEFEMGKAVRNATHHQIKPELPEKRQRVYEIILAHPEGITNKQIALELGWPINCVTGRVSELRQLELIIADGVDYLPDHEGRMHPNTIWRIA